MNTAGDNISVRLLEMKDAETLHDLRVRNRTFFTPFEPTRTDNYYTLENHKELIKQGIHAQEMGLSYYFGIVLHTEQLIGRVELTGIVRGPFQNANMGYSLDQQHNGKGYTTEAVRQVLTYAFHEINLHRVQAGVMPHNKGSIRVLEKTGFRFIGLSEKYLKINEKWEDHNLYAITKEDYY